MQAELDGETLQLLKAYCSPNLVEEVKALRCLFLVRLGEPENVENLEKSALRSMLLDLGEQGLRISLKQLQINFEVADI